MDLAAPPHVTHGLPVGDDDERPAVELKVDELLETFLGPDALAGEAERRFLLGGDLGPLHASRQTRDLERERPEEVGVGDVARGRDRATAPERSRPLGDLRHRSGDADLHDQGRDDRDDQGQDEEPHRVGGPAVPLRPVQVRGVEEHRDRAHGLVVGQERRRVDVPGAVADGSEPLGRDVPGDRIGHFGQGRRQDRGDVGRRGSQVGKAVVDGDAALGLSELLDDPLDRRRGLLGRGLDRVAERFGDEHRSSLQIADEPPALLTDLEIGEDPDDQHHREPDRTDQT